MGGGAGDAFNGGEFLGDELRDVAEAVTLDEDEQVVPPGHQEERGHFVKFCDAAGDAVEAAFPFGLHLDLDDRFDQVGVHFVVIDDGFVPEDDLVVFVLFDAALHLGNREVEHLGQIARCAQRVFFEQLEKWIHDELKLVGTARFELATPCTPCKCATGLRHVPNPSKSALSTTSKLPFDTAF